MSNTFQDFLDAIAKKESSWGSVPPEKSYGITNKYGYLGKYQMGEDALEESGYYKSIDNQSKNSWNGQWIGKDGVHSVEDFLSNHQAQENAIQAYCKKVWGQISSKQLKLDHYVGQVVGGIKITEAALIGGAHLSGIGNLSKFLKSNGSYIHKDGNGTPITTYMRDLGGYEIPYKANPQISATSFSPPTQQHLHTSLDVRIRDPQNTTPSQSKGNGHDETDRSFLNGRVMGSGGFQVNMPANVLNGDGMKNVAPSFITSDGFRPGANELSTYSQARGDIQNTWQQLHPAIPNKPMTPDTTWTNTHVSPLPDFLANTQRMAVLNTGSRTVKNIDPLVLDLDGDGVHLTNFQQKTVFFDVDKDGFKEQTGWVSATDGILVQDKNGDGHINDISETLSEHFVEGAKDGFEALATLDANKDGIFDEKDPAFTSLRVWVDANQNGTTEAGELKTLEEAGVKSITLKATKENNGVYEGNKLLASGTYTTSSGAIRAAKAVNFIVNPLGTRTDKDSTGVTVTAESGGKSYNATEDNGITIDVAAKGVQNAYGGAGNDTLIGDAQDNWLGGGAGSDTLRGGGGDDVLLIDGEDLQENIDGGEGFDIAMVVDSKGVSLDLAKANLEVANGGDGNDILTSSGNSSVFISGGKGDDIIVGSSANDALSGEDGDDLIDGSYGNDLIRGHRGDDFLMGGDGDDYLDGGSGKDSLVGGAGTDILIGGSGDDSLDGGDGNDIAQYAGSYGDYKVTKNDDGTLTVTDLKGRDGVDTLRNIEFISFSDISNINLAAENPMPVKDLIALPSTEATVIRASDILANDVDYQGDTLRITAISDGKGGTAVLQHDGNVLFTPTPGYTGSLSFKYTVADSKGNKGATAVVVDHEGTPTHEHAEMRGTVTLQRTDDPIDPLFRDQWYLAEANVLPVWKDYTGKGVKVGIFELDVMDHTHPDLAPNVDPKFTPDPDEQQSSHATLVSGVIGAARNGTGSVGVAYDAHLSSIAVNNPDQPTTAINLHKYANVHVANNSWGFDGSFGDNWLENISGFAALKEPALSGRSGLGTTLVFAAGNDREKGGNANYSNLINGRFTVTVGAINKTTDVSSLEISQKPFSNPGANILISAPGSNVTSTSKMLVTDNGSTFGNTYEAAQGTSFAAPVVSGVVALMLEANPRLGYRDIQNILAYCAKKVDPSSDWTTNGATNWNGGGMHTSHDYGFGLVDAFAAVRMAETWIGQKTGHDEIHATKSNTVNQAIPDQGSITNKIHVDDKLSIEHAEVELHLDHTRIGDLVVTLVSPSGTESILVNRPGKAPGSGDTDTGLQTDNLNFVFSTTHSWGESAAGDWTLKVEDKATGEVGTLKNWTLKLHGSPLPKENAPETPAAPVCMSFGGGQICAGGTISINGSTYGGTRADENVFIYTNELSTLTEPTRLTLTGTASRDTINAAAVTSNSMIDLNGSANLSGKAITLVGNLENAITGDGNDTLIGNSAHNLLYGGRGNDSLTGGAGDDTLIDGKGSDTLTGGTGKDTFKIIKDASSTDTITDFDSIGGEKIVLVGFGTLAFSALQITQNNADALVSMPDGQQLILKNISAASLTVNHFSFQDTLNFINTDSDSQRNRVSPPVLSETGRRVLADMDRVRAESAEPSRSYEGTAGDDTYKAPEKPFSHRGPLNYTIYGHDGNDTLSGNVDSDIIYGGNGDDILIGDAGTWAFAQGGNDTLYGEAGNDTLSGGKGNDTLYGGAGNDHLLGGSGNDTLDGGEGDDKLDGGTGSNILTGGGGFDTFVIEEKRESTDTITDFDLANDKIQLSFSDYALRYFENLVITQTDGDAHITFKDSQVIILKNTQATALTASHFLLNDTPMPSMRYHGTEGDDTFAVPEKPFAYRGAVNYTIYGHDGNDTLSGNVDSDIIYGGNGDDILIGDAGTWTFSQGGNDTLYGEAGNDTLSGGGGNDILDGGEGFDRIYGDSGNDTLYITGHGEFYGGWDSDVFKIQTPFNNHTLERTIRDFSISGNDKDRIDLSAFEYLKTFEDLSFSEAAGKYGGKLVRISTTESTPRALVDLYDVDKNALTADHFIFHKADITPSMDTSTTLGAPGNSLGGEPMHSLQNTGNIHSEETSPLFDFTIPPFSTESNFADVLP